MVIPVLATTAVLCLAAAVSWGRSARFRHRAWRTLDSSDADEGAISLAWGVYRKDLHAADLLRRRRRGHRRPGRHRPALGGALSSASSPSRRSSPWPCGATFVSEARLAQSRIELERRAAGGPRPGGAGPAALGRAPGARGPAGPRRLRGRPGLPGRLGHDGRRLLRRLPRRPPRGSPRSSATSPVTASTPPSPPSRPSTCCGSSSGSSATRPRRSRSSTTRCRPSAATRSSSRSCVVVFDTEAGTLRYTSAGHPAAWLWHDREVQPLRATGPLLMLDPRAATTSAGRSASTPTTCCLLYTDGLAEARDGEQLFGEDRIAAALRRDPGVAADVLCKSLLEAARDFSSGPINDDVAILAIRRELSAVTDRLTERLAKAADTGPRGQPRQGRRQARAPEQAVRARPPRPAARRGLVRRGRPAGQHLAPTTCPPTAWSPASAPSTAGPVCVMANDPTVKAGSWGARTVEKIVRLTELALRRRAARSSGSSTRPGPASPTRSSCSRAVAAPAASSTTRCACRAGCPRSAACSARRPPAAPTSRRFCDIVIMVEGNASMYLGSPRMAEMVIGEIATLEEMGGARMHATVSGCGDNLAADDEDAIDQARAYFTYFPQRWREDPPGVRGRAARSRALTADVVPGRGHRRATTCTTSSTAWSTPRASSRSSRCSPPS